MCSRSHWLEEQINSLDSKIQLLPEGKLVCTRNSDKFKCYKSDGHNLTYIPKREQKFVEQLALRRYLTCHKEELMWEKKAIDTYLNTMKKKPNLREDLLLKKEGYRQYLEPYITLKKEDEIWVHAPYEQNEKNPENRIHKTLSGNMVRSKSEALIDMVLYMNKIPFRYECALHLESSVIYPDFTLRHPETGKIFYWEHFGMMDDLVYCRNACSKLQLYTSCGIIPTIQLITTYETKDSPLTAEEIERIVKTYFG